MIRVTNERRCGFGTLLRGTALVSAALGALSFAAPAIADTLSYDFGDSGDLNAQPQSGGIWDLDPTSEAWLNRATPGNQSFANGDDAVFGVDGAPGGPVSLSLASDINVSSITIENGSFVIADPGGSTLSSAGTVLRLVDVRSGASLDLAPALAGRFQLDVDGELVLRGQSAGIERAEIGSGGILSLRGNSRIGNTAGTNDTAENMMNEGTIRALGANRILTVTGGFTNESGGILDGSDPDATLTVRADRITLNDGSILRGQTFLEGAIDNAADFDLGVNVPAMAGDLINRASGSLTVGSAVAGNGYDLTNAGRLDVAAGLTGLGTFSNSGAMTVRADGTLAADTIEHVVGAGSFTSAGTLEGAVTLQSDATLSNRITGSLVIRQGETVVADDLSVSGGTNLNDINVTENGTLRLTPGVTLNAPFTRVFGTVFLGAGSLIDGVLRLADNGLASGRGTVSGDLELSGTSGIQSTANLVVQGRLINQRSEQTNLSSLSAVTVSTIENLTQLTIDTATNADLIGSSGTLVVAADVTGNVQSNAALDLDGTGGAISLAGGLDIGAGRTTVTGSVAVQGGTIAAINVAAGGTLDINGDLQTSGRLRNGGGSVTLGQTGSVTTDLLLGLAGTTTLAGEVNGAVEIASAGTLRLDGATLNDTLRNGGTVEMVDAPRTGTSLRLAGGLTNTGTATLGTTSQRARIDGPVENSGTLSVTGTVTGTLTNRGDASVRGTVAALTNSGSGRIDLAGDIGSSFVNRGTAILRGSDVSGSLRNEGTMTLAGVVTARALVNADTMTVAQFARVTVGDPATGDPLSNTGSLRVEGTVTNRVDNDGELAMAATGAIESDLVNRGTADLAGNVSGQLLNTGSATVADGATATVEGGVKNLTGTLEVDGELTAAVTNGQTLVMGAGGLIAGKVDNASGATLVGNGEITGNVTNHGIVRLANDMIVEGNFTNTNLLTQSVNDTRLVVVGTFSNTGDINTGGFDRMTITAGTIRIADVSRVGKGVILDADILVDGVLLYDEAQTVEQNLSVADTGELIVSAVVTGGGDAVIGNAGVLSVDGSGKLVNLQRLNNRGIVEVAKGGEIASSRIINTAGALIKNSGALSGVIRNDARATLVSDGVIKGRLVNAGGATLAGGVTQSIVNTKDGTLTVSRLLRVGSLTNSGDVFVDVGGGLSAREGIVNATGGVLTSRGVLVGPLENGGTATLSGKARGRVTNGSGGAMVIDRDFAADAGLVNQIGGDLRLAQGARLQGSLASAGTVVLEGTIDGRVTNRGEIGLGGTIEGDVDNQGGTILSAGSGRINGQLINRSEPEGPLDDPTAPGGTALLRVAANGRLFVGGGTINHAGSRIEVLGTLRSVIRNEGVLVGKGTIIGDVVLSSPPSRPAGRQPHRQGHVGGGTGVAELEGVIAGNLTFESGMLDLTGNLSVTQGVTLEESFTLEAGRTLKAANVLNARDARLDLKGTMRARLTNEGTTILDPGAKLDGLINTKTGTLIVSGTPTIGGSVQNDGIIDLTNGAETDVLRINGGLSGTGVYRLDLDLGANNGAGGADLILVRDGPVTGDLVFDFNLIGAPAEITGDGILVLDADERVTENDFTVSARNLPPGTEQTIYALLPGDRPGTKDNIYVTKLTNPALGSIAGNIVLTQSLIGSVINRPTSPFVQGYAVPEDDACGAGAWARATAGRADATGSSSNGEFAIESSISARYRGLQFGGDLACFQGRIRGWDMAAGVTGGINDGSTNQPIFLQNRGSAEQATEIVASVNEADFRQVYGGVYLTASRGPLNADLQWRRERTDFTITNAPLTEGSDGLSLTRSEFESNASTLSGSLSYAIPIPQREGLIFVPTAGFALTDTTTDPITFDNGSILRIKDSKSRVAFVGGTLSKSRIIDGGISAVNYFATGTVYRDFSGDTESTFTRVKDDGSVESVDELRSDNLGIYGELSLGVNYLRVLEPGSAMRPRQFNASVRLDGRSGETLDSYAVTAQVRLQF